MLSLLSVPPGTVTLSREGKHLFVIQSDGQGSLYRTDGGLLLLDTLPWNDCLTSAFRYDQFRGTTELAVAAQDLIYRFDLETREALPFVPVAGATSISYKRDLLFIGTDEGKLLVYRLADRPTLMREIEIGSAVHTICVSTLDADAVNVYTDTGDLYLVNTADSQIVPIPFVDGESWQLVAMTYHPSLPYFAAVRRDGEAVVMNMADGSWLTLLLDVPGVHSLLFLSSGTELLVLGDGNPVKIDLASLLIDTDEVTLAAEVIETFNGRRTLAVAETEQGLLLAQCY